MLKKFLRWPVWVLLAAIVLAALFPTLPFFHAAKLSTAHASGGGGNGIISLSASVVRPSETVAVTGQGFASQDYVALQLDSFNSNPFGYISCDTNGNCTGNATMPSSSVAQGQHLVLATGYNSGITAQTPVVFTPRVFGVGGKPGLPVPLTGAAFNAYETVHIYWGTASGKLLGTTTTDASGNLAFSFNAPKKLANGSYLITVTRTQQKPAQVTTLFQVVPTTITSSPGIRDGQAVKVTLSGFLAQENVAISWNANGGQQLATLSTDTKGAISTAFVPPFAPQGSYTLTAVGATSGLQATSSLNVGPGILLAPFYGSSVKRNSGGGGGCNGPSVTRNSGGGPGGGYGNPGGTINVVGGGYTPGETVKVYFQTTKNGVVSATVDATGGFTVPLTVPVTYDPTLSYYVFAVSTAGNDHARAPFFFTPPALYTCSYTIYGQSLSFFGYGFASNETISIIWNYQQSGQAQIATTTAYPDGSFYVSLTPPSTPYQGNIVIAAMGQTSKVVATASVSEYAGISLNPVTGKVGATINVKGGNFGSAEKVTVLFNNAPVATATTHTDGTFTTAFKVPQVSGAGDIAIQTVGATSGANAYAPFAYTPNLKITPNTGPSNTNITVLGQHLSTSGAMYLFWEDPTQKGGSRYTSLGTFYADGNGVLTANITALANLKSGQQYYVLVNDANSHLWVQATFTAQ